VLSCTSNGQLSRLWEFEGHTSGFGDKFTGMRFQPRPPQTSNLAAFGWRSPSDFAFDSIQSRDAFHRIDGARRFVCGLQIVKPRRTADRFSSCPNPGAGTGVSFACSSALPSRNGAVLPPGSRVLMASRLTPRTSDELLATTGKLYWHVPVLAWSARVRSGDLLSRGARRRRGARVRRFRGIRQLFGAIHLALFSHPPWPF
jgi:hypothetical protein